MRLCYFSASPSPSLLINAYQLHGPLTYPLCYGDLDPTPTSSYVYLFRFLTNVTLQREPPQLNCIQFTLFLAGFLAPRRVRGMRQVHNKYVLND